MTLNIDQIAQKKVAVIGGGIAGATTALHLAEQGIHIDLIEKNDSLVCGPPICHLHAGGNLYREISVEQCIELLEQSIDSVRLYPHTLNKRPTLIVVPHSDGGDPMALLSRLEQIRTVYQELVAKDEANQVLGNPLDYFKLYSRDDLEKLKSAEQVDCPQDYDQWLIPFAQFADLEGIKYPVVAVNEFGWSVFRIAASAMLALEKLPTSRVMVSTKLVDMTRVNDQWQLTLHHQPSNTTMQHDYDYVINACGFETGIVDDLADAPRQRMVEFKAAYVTQWAQNQQWWPEVIFHGPRGTPNGMAQLTPYSNSIFQLHGMTKDITLFDGGLVASNSLTSQPQLPSRLVDKIAQGWCESVRVARSNRAIEHMSRFVPDYASAIEFGTPLYGAQQIPGSDDTLRAADVSFSEKNYARIEVVKGSSALEAAKKIVSQWQLVQSVAEEAGTAAGANRSIEAIHPISCALSEQQVVEKAQQLAVERGYPIELAQVYGK
ncbi:FAD-dependent oxidoreductase [Vibrio renipiscarius]|uniref:Oxidoreductase n=1 Tax=Vibrio renipiscarius TaxID=1461322 RepID=A0A0C2JDG6_9VIBR|nr:FAD-dependent oxidoreductase [Vibrio renipiscarius]KII75979.1 oxidoreductase [Vibrio renipiscarius]KII79083.1 oxidoreductase [Vibrio renipiscarius]